jgi:glycine/D-amino acid oxidase-like deaminating enzyme
METAEIAVIGGGIVGCSVAYHLARKGCRNVVLLEKDLVCFGSTGKSAGGVRAQFSSEVNIRLSLEALKILKGFQDELGVDPGFRQTGYLFLATTDDELALFRQNVALQQRFGIPVELLAPDEIRRRVPILRVDDVAGGSFCPWDGNASPHEVTHALAAGARRLGARVLEGRAVTEVAVEGGRVVALETSAGPLACGAAVICAGPYAGHVGAMAGVDLPVKPYRRQLFVTKPMAGLPEALPLTIDFHRGWYFRREGEGILFSGPKDAESSFNTHVDWEDLEAIVATAIHRVPLLAKAEVLRGWGGSYDITPDHNPLLGPAPGVGGLYVAAGFSGHGFMHGPIAGRLMAELILDGAPGIDLSPFAPDRFARGASLHEPLTAAQ